MRGPAIVTLIATKQPLPVLRASLLRPVIACHALLLISPSVGAAQIQRDSTRRHSDSVRAEAQVHRRSPGIQDNSFLVEEAYNQEPGVVQHISGFQHDARGAVYAYQFTQEWPVGGITNQLSYSLSLLRPGEHVRAGVGDVRLNYRYQLMGDGDARFAVAPRLTAIVPTGDYRNGRGAGALGIEGWLPASLVLSDQVVVHGNLGTTITPHARDVQGNRATTRAWTAGGSIVCLPYPFFNVLVEALHQSTSDVVGPNRSERASSTTIVPGIRWAYNFPSGLQIVPGIAFPIGVGPNRAASAVFLYLSFEHPFSKVAREGAAKAR